MITPVTAARRAALVATNPTAAGWVSVSCWPQLNPEQNSERSGSEQAGRITQTPTLTELTLGWSGVAWPNPPTLSWRCVCCRPNPSPLPTVYSPCAHPTPPNPPASSVSCGSDCGSPREVAQRFTRCCGSACWPTAARWLLSQRKPPCSGVRLPERRSSRRKRSRRPHESS